jgi:glycosyltransferase involved in cell wall biosynthesis
MRVAFIHPFFWRYPRGIERYLVGLASALVRRNVEVEIITWAWADHVRWADLDASVKVITLDLPRYFRALFAVPGLVRAIRRGRYDHAFVHFADYGEREALLFTKLFGFPVSWSAVFHFPYSQVPHRYESFLKWRFSDQAAHLIAVSGFVAGQAQSALGRDLSVIGHGVDTSVFRPDPVSRQKVRAQLGIEDAAPVLLTVAALESRKGVQHVLHSLPVLVSQWPNLRYIIVGDGPMMETLAALSVDRGVAENVVFTGWSQEPWRYLQAADIFVMLSEGEASPLAPLEAMACGLPVVTSDSPPFDELLKPNWGVQVDRNDRRLVAETLGVLLENPGLRRSMAQAGLARVEEAHNWHRVASEYVDLVSPGRID